MGNAYVVIGSNFGDEGKGLVTNYYSNICKSTSTLNILYNGGCQRGHTTNNHVFHCFGSGTLSGAYTYYDKDFLVDPIAWNIERYQLGIKGEIFVHPKCFVVTPYDTLLNQLLEKKRGITRHGSCGMGIYETILRSKQYPIYFEDLIDSLVLYNKLQEIYHNYLPKRLEEIGICAFPTISIDNFMTNAHLMQKECQITRLPSKMNHYVFEGGQGLLLDKDNTEYFPHLTPSHPGSNTPAERCKILKAAGQIEQIFVNYVTRPYMTRHGAGRFDTECAKEDINPYIIDRTNQPNEYQGTLRFGYMDVPLMAESIKKDFVHWKDVSDVKVNICVTQTNYTDNKIVIGKDKYLTLSEFKDQIEKLSGVLINIKRFDSELI